MGGCVTKGSSVRMPAARPRREPPGLVQATNPRNSTSQPTSLERVLWATCIDPTAPRRRLIPHHAPWRGRRSCCARSPERLGPRLDLRLQRLPHHLHHCHRCWTSRTRAPATPRRVERQPPHLPPYSSGS
ncbi:hypothetical protein SEVIR_5G197050v4 [Setaria viridis]